MPELAKKMECTGCTACASICPKQCIEMVRDNDGFPYPEIDLRRCVDCMLCTKHCPVLLDAPPVHPTSLAYAAYSNDLKLREESSSGGIFSEMALEILKRGGVVFGAAYDAQFEIKHVCIETIEELYKLRGAKYAQSSLDGIFLRVRDELNRQREVLFSGTPCQVTGLKSFLQREYATLICVDFVCHGVPSPNVWREYVRYRSRLDNNGVMPLFVNMRSKESGWSRYQYSNQFIYAQKKWSSQNRDNLFMKLFVGDYINRLCCQNCKTKGYHRVSDVTLGDFWGIWEVRPEMDDDRGTSLVILHSEKAGKLLNQIQDRITCQPVRLEEASLMNPSLLESSAAKEERDTFLAKGDAGKFDELQTYFEQEGTCMKESLFYRISEKIKRTFRAK